MDEPADVKEANADSGSPDRIGQGGAASNEKAMTALRVSSLDAASYSGIECSSNHF